MNFEQKVSNGKQGSQDLGNITCYHCDEKRHYAKTCPKKKNENEQVHANINEGWEYGDDDDDMEYMYHHTDRNHEWDERILIDSHSTIDMFKNKKYLIDIHTTVKPCSIQCNVGTIQVTKKGMFGNIPVWFHLRG